jgi:transposase
MIAACRQPGVSSAAVAQAHSVNANLLRRWVKESVQGQGAAVRRVAPTVLVPEAFIALPVSAKPAGPPIQIEVRRGATTVTVQWPVTALQECSLWLRELLK